MNLLDELKLHTGAVVDRHGEHHISCPACGHVSTPKDPHCSFSARGWHCFSCGAGGSLQDLARRLGEPVGVPPPPHREKESRRPHSWQADPEPYLRQYERHPRKLELWNGYKRLDRRTIERMRLGVGVLPASRCPHERLVIPVLDGSIVAGLRGRSLGCSCGKWLASGGWDLDLVPLYNQGSLQPGCVAWIVENPVDALMISDRTGYAGLATYSVSYWRERWTRTLQETCPSLVIVAFDNDLPGNGGGPRRQEFADDWLRTHQRLPDPAGPRLANRLLIAGLPAVLYRWGQAEYKADIGSLLGASV